MIREPEVRAKIAALIQHSLSLEAFEHWLEGASRAMHVDSDRSSVDLVSSIHVLLSERDDHILSELDLRSELARLLENIEIEVRDAPAVDRKRSALSSIWLLINEPSHFDNAPRYADLMARNNSSELLVLHSAA